eukprot:gene19204-biopygen7321
MPVLLDSDRVVTDPRDKAEVLIKQYAAVSRLETTDAGAEKRLRREIERRLRDDEPSPAAPPRSASQTRCGAMRADLDAMRRPFSAAELGVVLRSLRKRKAAGPDAIANEMLSHLGPKGREALLALCNASWASAEVPRAWRRAEIIPLLKKGKDAQAAKSYRPVA